MRFDRYIDFNPLNFCLKALDQIQHLEYCSQFTLISGSFPPLLVLCSEDLTDLTVLAKDPFCKSEQSIPFSNSLRLDLTFESKYRHRYNAIRLINSRVAVPVQLIWLYPEELWLGTCQPRLPSR
jgi:hypothetical protein